MIWLLSIMLSYRTDTGFIEHKYYPELEISSFEACIEAAAIAEQEIMEKYENVLALTTECRPKNKAIRVPVPQTN